MDEIIIANRLRCVSARIKPENSAIFYTMLREIGSRERAFSNATHAIQIENVMFRRVQKLIQRCQRFFSSGKNTGDDIEDDKSHGFVSSDNCKMICSCSIA